MLNKASGRWPDFLVIGSMKCGTTSLHHYLSRHPEVHVSRPKELNYFVGDLEPAIGKRVPHWSNWHRSVEWYRQHYESDTRICGELSPAYVGGPWIRKTAARIHQLIPNARLLLLVRQPLDRCWSHYLMERMNGGIPSVSYQQFMTDGGFEEYRSYSDYGSQLQAFLEHFPRESILVVESKALDQNRRETLRGIFRFLGVDPDFHSSAFDQRLFEGSGRRFPSELGSRILNSGGMGYAKRSLPFTAFEWVRELVLYPFSIEKPASELSKEVEGSLVERYRREVALARRLSGLPLKSLEV